MPRVLRIINRFNLGGPTYNVAYLSKYMAPEFDTLLIGGKKGENEGASDYIVKNLGLHPIIIPEMQREISAFNDYIAYQKIKHIIKRWKPDIVHTHASKAGFLGRAAASSLGVPIIIHTFHGHIFHSYFKKNKTRLFKNLERRMAAKSNRIIAISEIQKKELYAEHHIATEDKIEVIPLGFDLDRFQVSYEEKRKDFRNRYSLDSNEIAVGMVGRLVPVKNHRLFIKSLALSKAQANKPIRAFIIGDGELKEDLQEYAKSLNLTYTDNTEPGVKADITFTSWIKNVDWAYAGLDIAALTSFNEGTPVSLIEAQAANTPVLSTNVGGIGNVVLENTTAFLVANNDERAFSEALTKLVNDDTLRSQMGNKGWEHVKQQFHYQRMIDDMKVLYYRLLTEDSP